MRLWQNLQQWRFQLETYSLFGLLYAIWLRIRGRELYLGGHCTSCGRCCRKLSLTGLDGWIRNEKEFEKVVAISPGFERFQISGRDEQGFLIFSCSWHTPEGYCGDYENRLPLCKNFPEKSLKFCGGGLPPGCGYYFKEVVPFAKILKNERGRQDENSSR